MSDSKTLKPGIYRHYKGANYRVYELATQSETQECLVVYRPLYGEGKLWVRPLTMFLETITINGKEQPRFQFLGEF